MSHPTITAKERVTLKASIGVGLGSQDNFRIFELQKSLLLGEIEKEEETGKENSQEIKENEEKTEKDKEEQENS